MPLPHMTLLRAWQDFSIPAIKPHWNKPRATGSVTIHGGKLASGFVFEPNFTTAQRLI